MSSNVVPGLITRPVFANSRNGPLPSPDRDACSAGYPGLAGSATTPSTTCNGAARALLSMKLPQSSTDSAAGVAEDVDRPFGRAGVCPDVAAEPVFPLPGLPVPLVQAASSIAITAT